MSSKGYGTWFIRMSVGLGLSVATFSVTVLYKTTKSDTNRLVCEFRKYNCTECCLKTYWP